MKTELLKRLRAESWSKYEIRSWDHVAGCSEKPWRICTGPNRSLAYHEYSTREKAVEAAKRLWHEVAEKYLWDHRAERRKNKYPY